MRQAEADPRAAVAVSALPAELRRHLLSSRFARTRLQHLLERLQRLGLLQIEAEPPSRLALGLGLGFGLGFGALPLRAPPGCCSTRLGSPLPPHYL